MKWLVSLIVVLTPHVAFAACPAVADRSAEAGELFAGLQSAGNELEAQPFNRGLWEIWTDAPDELAQAMLDDGMSRIQVFDLAGAVDALDRLIAYCPDYAEGYNQRAFAYFLGGDFPSALRDLDRTLAILPDHVGALSGRGLTLIEMGRDDEAQDALRAAVDLNPWLGERVLLREPAGTDL